MKISVRSKLERLSRPGAAPLIESVAASLADRIAGDRTHSAELVEAVAGLSEMAFSELARHALEAALEALDSQPELTVDLMPATTNAVRAQIARGCIGEQVLRRQGYVLAEVDFEIWEQLLEADLRCAPVDTLGPAEVAERQQAALDDLGVGHTEASQYQNDQRVVLAMSGLFPLTL